MRLGFVWAFSSAEQLKEKEKDSINQCICMILNLRWQWHWRVGYLFLLIWWPFDEAHRYSTKLRKKQWNLSRGLSCTDYFVRTREQVEYKCVLLLVSYYCDIPENPDISEALHVFEVNQTYVKWIATSADIFSGRKALERSLREKKVVNGSLQKLQGTTLDAFRMKQCNLARW